MSSSCGFPNNDGGTNSIFTSLQKGSTAACGLARRRKYIMYNIFNYSPRAIHKVMAS